MKTVKDIENCKTLVRDNLEFLLDNLPDYRIEQMARDAAAKRFESETGLQVDCSVNAYDQTLRPYLFPNVGLDMFAAPVDNLKTLENLLAQHGLSIDTVKTLNRWRHLFKECYFRHKEGEEWSVHGSDYADKLTDFLTTVSTGTISPQILGIETHGFKHSDTAFGFTVGNITVKKYKNGRLIIRGVSQVQLDFITNVFNHHKAYTQFLSTTIQ
jgi:hypothetical protein